ncbi:MAG TPA: hypothetical protein VK470_07900 [Bacteroidota bacterium]|nr:hypothetical protein [Bacteroidota bacterium]
MKKLFSHETVHSSSGADAKIIFPYGDAFGHKNGSAYVYTSQGAPEWERNLCA